MVAEPAAGAVIPLALPATGTAHPWLDGRDPRLRVGAAVTFAAVAVSLQGLEALAAALAVALAAALAAGLGPALLLRRLLALEGFMAVLLVSLPFTVPGEPIVAVGPLTASGAGVERAVAIVLRANAVVVMMLALAGTLGPVTLGHALARLGMPAKLVHLLLLTVRYLDVLYQEYARLRLAMRARAFVPAGNRHTWRTFGWLVGMLLVRSLDRAGRVLAAMRCRGFQGRLYLLAGSRWSAGDTGWALAAGAVLAGLLGLEHLA